MSALRARAPLVSVLSVLIVGFALEWLPSGILSGYARQIALWCGVQALLALSLNFVLGFGGQFVMGHAGLMAIGAYASAVLADRFPALQTAGGAFALISASGLVAAALSAALVSPLLRLKGDTLAVVTLGLGEAIRLLLLQFESLGGARGWPGISLSTSYMHVGAFVALALWASYRLLQTRSGHALVCIRDDRLAAQSLGFNPEISLLKAYVISGFFSGAAGSLFAHLIGYLHPSNFDFNRSFEMIVFCVLGGLGSVPGAALAAVLLTLAKELLRPLQEWTHVDFRMVLYALLLVFTMVFRPRGLRPPTPLPEGR